MKKALLIITVLLSFIGFSQTLDPTFNGNGIVTNQFSLTADLNFVNDAILQPDGKMVYVGGINLGGIGYFPNSYIARVNPDGTLDTTFNGIGFYISKETVNDYSQIFHTVKMQANGKIVVAARNKVYQFNSDGSLDSTFENGLYISPNILNVALQSDGKIVLTGFNYNGVHNIFAVTRLNIDGSFDATFGNGGIQNIDFINNVEGYSYAIAIQSDNKILVGGTEFNYTTHTDFAIARLTTSGILDTSFGTGGTVYTPLTGSQRATSIDIQSDGKILVGGSSDGMFAAIRYNTNGVLDMTFNNTGELITSISTPTSYDPTNNKQTIKYLSTDKIVLAGTSNSNFALMQFNSDGSADTNFGTNGITIYDAGNNENFEALLLNPDEKIIIAGYTFYSGGAYYAGATEKIRQLQFSSTGIVESSYQLNLMNGTDKIISIIEQADGKTIALTSTKSGNQNDNVNLIKYNVDGGIDTTFGINGSILVSNIESFAPDYFKLKQQIDGKLLVSGGNTSIHRFNSDGSIDNGFGTNGFVDVSTTILNAQIDFVDNIFPQPDGKIFVTGEVLLDSNSTTESLVLLKLNSDGTLDTTFGTNGYATTRFNYFGLDSDEFAKEIYIQSDFKIVVSTGINTAYGFSPVDNIFGITRFDANGVLDTTFGTNGYIINTDSKSFATELLGYSDDKFIINYNSSNTTGATAKYNADGSFDNSFGINGMITDTVFYNDMILQLDGKIVKGGTYNNQFYITRFNSNGDIDTTFGTNGSLITPISYYSNINKLLNLQNGKILAGGYSFNGTNQVFAQARYTFDNLGITNNANINSFKIYPNPANNQFTIDLGNEIKSVNYQVKILNLLGQEVHHSFEKTIITTIPVTWTGKGLYSVNIYDEQDNLLKIEKIIVE